MDIQIIIPMVLSAASLAGMASVSFSRAASVVRQQEPASAPSAPSMAMGVPVIRDIERQGEPVITRPIQFVSAPTPPTIQPKPRDARILYKGESPYPNKIAFDMNDKIKRALFVYGPLNTTKVEKILEKKVLNSQLKQFIYPQNGEYHVIPARLKK